MVVMVGAQVVSSESSVDGYRGTAETRDTDTAATRYMYAPKLFPSIYHFTLHYVEFMLTMRAIFKCQ